METVNLSVIDTAENDIKALIAKAVANSWTRKKLDDEIAKIMDETTKNMPDELAEDFHAAIKNFIDKSIGILSSVFGVMQITDISALAAVEQIDQNLIGSMRMTKVIKDSGVKAYSSATSGRTYYKDIYNEVRKLMIEMADDPVKVDDRVSFRSSLEMHIRWAKNEEMIDNARKSENKFAWISTHANCSIRCQRWQGRLYSLDNTFGEIDGIKYIPLEKATDNYYITKKGKIWKNGCLSGFNCRHYLIPYKKGNKPQSVPADVIKRQRELETRQRKIERSIRREKARWKVLRELPDAESKRQAKEAHKKAMGLEVIYERFCKKYDLVRYDQRLTVTDAEIEIMRRSGTKL